MHGSALLGTAQLDVLLRRRDEVIEDPHAHSAHRQELGDIFRRHLVDDVLHPVDMPVGIADDSNNQPSRIASTPEFQRDAGCRTLFDELFSLVCEGKVPFRPANRSRRTVEKLHHLTVRLGCSFAAYVLNTANDNILVIADATAN